MYKDKRLGNIYSHMKKRCYDPNCKAYKNYGGRGITVCKEWLNPERVHLSLHSNPSKGFLTFKEWALVNGYTDELTLDRIDVNGNYDPSNCRWVSRKLQNRNKRNTIFLTAFGKTQSLGQWAEETGLTVKAIDQRLRKSGFEAEKALMKKDFRERLITYKGETKTLTEWAENLGINLRTLKNRIDLLGWSIERAFEEEVK